MRAPAGQGRLGRGQLSEGVRRRLHRARLAVPAQDRSMARRRAGRRRGGARAVLGPAGDHRPRVCPGRILADQQGKTQEGPEKVPGPARDPRARARGDARRDGAALGRERRRGVAKRVARRAAAGRAPGPVRRGFLLVHRVQRHRGGLEARGAHVQSREGRRGERRRVQAGAPAGVRTPRRRLRIGRPATLQGHRHARDRELLLRRRPGPAPGHRVLGAVQAEGLRHALVRQGAGPGNAGPEHQADHRLDAGPGAAGLAHAALREEPVRLALLCLRRAGRGHPAAPRLGAAAEPRAVPAGLRPAAAPVGPCADFRSEGRGHRHRHVILDGRRA